MEQAAGVRVDITSEREGEVTGTHTLELNRAGDRIVLTHEAKSRRTFAEGAVLAAEWIAGKTGFYDFKDIFASSEGVFHHRDTEAPRNLKNDLIFVGFRIISGCSRIFRTGQEYFACVATLRNETPLCLCVSVVNPPF